MFTRQHFELVAQVLNNYATNDKTQKEIVTAIAHAFAHVFGGNNSRFDRARFLRACGVD